MSIFDPSIAVTSCKLISSFPERPAHFLGEAFVTVPIARAPTGMTTYPLITTSFATDPDEVYSLVRDRERERTEQGLSPRIQFLDDAAATR